MFQCSCFGVHSWHTYTRLCDILYEKYMYQPPIYISYKMSPLLHFITSHMHCQDIARDYFVMMYHCLFTYYKITTPLDMYTAASHVIYHLLCHPRMYHISLLPIVDKHTVTVVRGSSFKYGVFHSKIRT